MNTTLNKIIRGLVLAVFLIGGLGPTVAEWAGFVPPKAYAVISHVVAVCSGLSLYAMASPFLQPFLPTKTPDQVIAAAKSRAVDEALAKGPAAPKLPLVMLCLSVAIVVVQTVFVVGCTAAQGQAALADIQAADDALMAATPMTCTIAETVDPTLGTVVCAVVTATGELVNVVTKSFTPAVAAAIVKAHPSPSPAVTAKLKLLAVKP